ncbi:CYTH and CHAD domain-containing protein [Pseudonocardia sp. HH130630-07]|uniref:CYTH and CHAD domain-containing protein n=1 Tax=Pseudonocardia sp. HH130630-07 TaxID=1690815 RepID=UPI000814DC08|nr:CHAD domain-containing protein [Pseudonocardia sp. HH130630-07]ANY08098.1 hypothetical protein AFB00_19425 [Pseudonocardia sp. HH130630-07]
MRRESSWMSPADATVPTEPAPSVPAGPGPSAAPTARPSVVDVPPGDRPFHGPAHAGAPRLSGVGGVAGSTTVTDAEVREYERVDTADLRLLAAGVELARERVVPDRASPAGPAATWVLRLPDGDPAAELRSPVPDADAGGPGEVPPPFEAVLAPLHAGAPLRPVGRVRLVRTTVRVHDDADRELATLWRDEITATTLGESTSVQAWSEAVLRPGAGGSAVLAGIEDALRETGLTAGPGGARRRLAALLAAAGPADPPRHRGDPDSAGQVVLDYLARQVDALTEREADLRADRPDAVHQMRVAARRARSALRTYRRLLPGPRTAHLVAELRWLGRELAGERDAEVQQARLEERLAALDPDLVLGTVRADVARHFARTRATTSAVVGATVDGERYAALHGALRRMLADPPLSERAARPAAEVLPRLVGRTARRLDRRMRIALADLADGRVAPVSLHDARKSGKQLRYATEVARPAVGKPATVFAKRMKAVQTVLGDHQDAVVSRELLRGLADGSTGAFTLGVLHGRDSATMAGLEDRLPEIWEHAWTTKARRWMQG